MLGEMVSTLAEKARDLPFHYLWFILNKGTQDIGPRCSSRWFMGLKSTAINSTQQPAVDLPWVDNFEDDIILNNTIIGTVNK